MTENYAKEFFLLTAKEGDCWHIRISKYSAICKKCGADMSTATNPTYSHADDILKRMRGYCEIDKYEDFICTVGFIIPLYDEPPIYSIEEKYILDPPALLKKAVEFLEKKGE